MNNFRFIVYLRKSSESEERQELSIPAQKAELDRVIAARGLRVVGAALEEAMSAKKPGRPVFGDLMRRIKRGEADGIICWKLDRLSRNPRDGGELMWALGEKTIKAIVTPERVYTGTGDDKLLMSIIFGMATKYVDDLSDNVRRGNRQALSTGRWTGRPKLGYARDPKTKELVPDLTRFELVRDMWRLLLDGQPVMEILELATNTWGLRTPEYGRHGGGQLCKSQVYKLFRDKFYAGIMVNAGVMYQGNHPPMITPGEFDRAQDLLNGKVRPLQGSKRLSFPYRGLLVCGACDAMVTAKNLTKRNGKTYRYYHCCRKSMRLNYCSEPAIQEHEIEAQLAAFLESIVPPPVWLERVLELVDRLEMEQERARAELDAQRALRLEQLRIRQGRLVRLVTNDTLPEDMFKQQYNELEEEKHRLQVGNADDLATGGASGRMKLSIDAISLLKQAPLLLRGADSRQKAAVVRKLVCYAKLKDKSLLISAQNPFLILSQWTACSSLSAYLDSVETFLKART